MLLKSFEILVASDINHKVGVDFLTTDVRELYLLLCHCSMLLPTAYRGSNL